MKLPRIRIRTLLIVVAIVALTLGSIVEGFRLRRLSEKYTYIAWAAGNDLQNGLSGLAMAEARLKQLKAASDSTFSDLPQADREQSNLLHVRIEGYQAEIAASANLVQIYEHAASHPWESLTEPAFPRPTVRNSPIVQRFLSTPPAPAPPRPTEFGPKKGRSRPASPISIPPTPAPNARPAPG